MTKLPFSSPIVGGRFRPPADQVINMVPAGTTVLLKREPLNPHDPNAIAVFLLETPETEEILEKIYEGVIYPDALDPPWQDPEFPFHLGFCPRPKASLFAPYLDKQDGEASATITFSLEGRPQVEFTVEVEDGLQPGRHGDDPGASA